MKDKYYRAWCDTINGLTVEGIAPPKEEWEPMKPECDEWNMPDELKEQIKTEDEGYETYYVYKVGEYREDEECRMEAIDSDAYEEEYGESAPSLESYVTISWGREGWTFDEEDTDGNNTFSSWEGPLTYEEICERIANRSKYSSLYSATTYLSEEQQQYFFSCGEAVEGADFSADTYYDVVYSTETGLTIHGVAERADGWEFFRPDKDHGPDFIDESVIRLMTKKDRGTVMCYLNGGHIYENTTKDKQELKVCLNWDFFGYSLDSRGVGTIGSTYFEFHLHTPYEELLARLPEDYELSDNDKAIFRQNGENLEDDD